jgi:hypothetical protein
MLVINFVVSGKDASILAKKLGAVSAENCSVIL